MILDECNAIRIENLRRAFDAAHDADRDGGGELVGKHEIDFGIDDLTRLDAIEAGVPG